MKYILAIMPPEYEIFIFNLSPRLSFTIIVIDYIIYNRTNFVNTYNIH